MILRRTFARLIAATLILGIANPGTACGPWFPRQYLAQNGPQLLAAPEFFAEIELKLLAREFPTPFKAVREVHPRKSNAERDLKEFDAAIADGSIAPRDPDAAREAHRRMRNVLTQLADLTLGEAGAVPAEMFDGLRAQVFPSEFADYHDGAIAFARLDHPAARAAWERLLARPEKERRYRSVEAAFMMGVIASVDGLDNGAKWLGMARDLVQQGFRDPAGLAAASYAWESSWHYSRGELHEAAECALRAISSGYPTRNCIEPADDSPEELAKFAADPLLRRIHTRLLLADFTGGWTEDKVRDEKLRPWLVALEAARITEFAGAEHVAWAHYSTGDYAAAKRWLKRAPAKSPESLWLEGKLAARDGRREDSLRAMAQAARLLAERPEPRLEVTQQQPDSDTPRSLLLAEHGIAALNASEFQAALMAFLRGNHWVDAAYVAERLLTVGELKAFVGQRPWKPEWDALSYGELETMGKPQPKAADPEDEFHLWMDQTREVSEHVRTRQLRWLLARRLARLGRFAEARPYFSTAHQAQLDTYAAGLRRGKDAALSREQRAMALWEAALEARYNGIELLGTEVAPDWFVHDGSYEEEDVEAIRTGLQILPDYDEKNPQPLPIRLQAGPVERARLKRTGVEPDKRWHYRYLAADLAWKATHLLPSNDRRLAEMLDLAGRWLASRDEQAADRFYQALESRCAETDIGRRAQARRWFVDIEEYAIPNRPKEERGGS